MAKIEVELQQSKFKDPWQRAYLNLFFTNNWIRDKTAEVFKKEDITHQQFNVLRILRGSRPNLLNAGQIKERMVTKTPDLTRLVERLVKKGFINRTICEDNRRKVEIGITDKGLEIVEKTSAELDSRFKDIKFISEAQADELNDLLDKLRGS